MKHLFGTLTLTLTLSLVASTLPAFADQAVWTTGLFDMPESALYDKALDRIVLSVIGGHPGEGRW